MTKELIRTLNKLLWGLGLRLTRIHEDPIMIHVITSIYKIRRRYSDSILCVETGTIRSLREMHWGTKYIAEAAGRDAKVDGNASAPHREKRYASERVTQMCPYRYGWSAGPGVGL